MSTIIMFYLFFDKYYNVLNKHILIVQSYNNTFVNVFFLTIKKCLLLARGGKKSKPNR
jgi:hypothetical protein